MKKLFVIALALALGCSAGDIGSSTDDLEVSTPGAHGVRLGVSMNPRTDHVPISREKHKAPRVIYSMKVPNLQQDEELRVRADLTITFCDDFDVAGKSSDGTHSPCYALHSIGSYEGLYTPNLSTAVVFGKSPNDADGPLIDDWQDGECKAHAHHCSRAIRASVKHPPPGDVWVNVIAAANDSHARGPDVMNVENNNGGVYVLRLGSQRTLPDWRQDRRANDEHFHVEQSGGSGDIAYQIELHDVHPGDIIDAYGAMKIAVPNNPMQPLVKGSVALSNDRHHFRSDQNDVKVFVPHGGTDCRDDTRDGCRVTKAGATIAPSWANTTMYVTLVAQAECGSEPNGKYDAIVHDGSLSAAVWKK